MEVRPIDRESLLRELTCDFTGTPFHGNRKVTIGEVRRIIESMPTLTQPNEPLTLEELSLCNDPVWIKRIAGEDLSDDGWAIVEGPRCLTWINGIPLSWEIRVWWPGSEVADYPKPEDYGKIWFAYRRPPEGEEKYDA